MSSNSDSNSARCHICLRRRYKAFGVEGEGLFLFSDRDIQILEGQVFVDLLPFLKDGADEADVADQLEARYPRTFIHYAFQLLAERKLLTKMPHDGAAIDDAFWDELDVDPGAARQRLSTTTVGVTAVGLVDARPAVRALRSLGFRARVVDLPTDESLHIVITDDYLAPVLTQLAGSNRRDHRPWLLARGTGSELWIGPLFETEEACFECLTWRLRTNGALAEYLGRRLGKIDGINKAIARTKIHGSLIANIVALEAAKWVAGHGAATHLVKTIDLRTLQSSEHVLRQRPQCPICGNPQLQTESLTQPVCVTGDEQPECKTLEDFIPFVSSITGIVTRLARAPTGIPSLHSYTAYFGFTRDVPDFQALKNGLLSQAAGVGTNAEQAKIGAICEALERYSGMYHGDEPAILASYAQLDPATTIHPGACMLYSNRQYALRDQINARGAAFDLVPRPFDETAVLAWTGVWSITSQRFKLLPSTYLFYSYPQPPGGPFCWADSNGCAAGRTLTDAVRRGLLELIERDSAAIWWYNRLRRPRVDLASFRSEYFDLFVEAYDRFKREVWVLDITSDLGIPSFVAVSRFTGGKPEDILLAFGAHLDARIAIEHALCEMNHLLPAVLPENRNPAGDYPYPEPSQKHWWRNATIETEAYLLPAPEMAPRQSRDYSSFPPNSEAEQVTAVCNGLLQERGFEILVLNQTRPDIRVPVAKVIVPGMRHFWARFAPGRLYSVPVGMGWLAKAHTEEELNPIAMFL
jgi:ribosomal protein S12 methylthiotransferase accessory factor